MLLLRKERDKGSSNMTFGNCALASLGVLIVMAQLRNQGVRELMLMTHQKIQDSVLPVQDTFQNETTAAEPANKEQQQQTPHYYGLAMTGALNHQVDPQRKKKTRPSYQYIQTWYESLHKISPDITGVVLENMYADAFKATKTSEQVSFVTLNPKTHPCFVDTYKGRQRGINDQLYFCYEWYLNKTYGSMDTADVDGSKNATTENHATIANRNQYVLITDSHDVELLRNPFEYMHKMDQLLGTRQFYVGSEGGSKPGQSFMSWTFKKCFNETYELSTVYNSGIVAGHVSVVRKVLRQMNTMFEKLKPRTNCNMGVLEKVVQEHWKANVVTGYPFHTKFNSMQGADESLAYIKHK